jgi:hypothetical protein
MQESISELSNRLVQVYWNREVATHAVEILRIMYKGFGNGKVQYFGNGYAVYTETPQPKARRERMAIWLAGYFHGRAISGNGMQAEVYQR